MMQLSWLKMLNVLCLKYNFLDDPFVSDLGGIFRVARLLERVGSGSDVDDKRRMARVAPARGGWAVAAAIASASGARIVRGRSLADDDPHEAGGPHVVQRGDRAHEQTGEEMGEGVNA